MDIKGASSPLFLPVKIKVPFGGADGDAHIFPFQPKVFYFKPVGQIDMVSARTNCLRKVVCPSTQLIII
jgi:hypothetical protein